ncbi:MAG: GGDEF domain-containing protein [Oscillospiraceae bacterium]|nr:GGDEF domain-containing protein [Oscillospiraceae bacterium]
MKRYNIALLVAKLTDHFSKELARGAMDTARKLNADLTIIPGSYVGAQDLNELYDRHYEYQYNVLFDYAAHAKFDYIIAAAGSIAYSGDSALISSFLSKFRSAPLLSICTDDKDVQSIGFNNSVGMDQAVKYLAEHGRHFIGLMAGNPNNFDCRERTAAFRKALEKNGLEFRESYIIDCDLGYNCMSEAERLIDENPELDSIICASDVIAAVVYEVLADRGLEVGRDIAVIGFDDQPISKELYPPLATIRADVYQLGVKAVEKAVSDLIGASPREMNVDTRFIPRPSCFADIREFMSADLLDSPTDIIKKAVTTYISELSSDAESRNITQVLGECVDLLDEYYIKAPADEKAAQKLYDLLHHLSSTGLRKLAEMCRIYSVHEIMYIWLIRRCHKENLGLVRQVYNEIDRKLRRRYARAASAERDHSQLENMFVRDTIIDGANLHNSYASILRRLTNLGVNTAYLYILEHPIIHNYGFEYPEDVTWEFKSFCYGADVFSVPDNEQKMYTPEVFRNSTLVSDRPRILVAMVLYSAETQYGLALFEPVDSAFFNELELVSYQLSSAVRTLDILRDLNNNMLHVSNRNTELENESQMDELTRVFNRKGFYKAAEALIDIHRDADFIVSYVDTGDLKRINQYHGHIEGDFAIKLTSDCLRHMFGRSAVIGRMGGGEFAVIIHSSHILSIDDLTRRRDKFIGDFNRSKLKPYTYSLSMGIIQTSCSSRDDLEGALEAACEDIIANEGI